MSKEKPKRTRKQIKDEQKEEHSKRMSDLKVGGLYDTTENIMRLNRDTDFDALSLYENLEDQSDSVLDGNTRPMEIMLTTQAQTLNSLFHFAVMRISRAETLTKLDTYTDLAIKANNACRKSLLALSQIKNPAKATFIKQQNNAVNQQVNNSEPQVLKNSEKNPTNELLSNEGNHATLDTSGAQKTGNFNPKMAAVETVNRS